MRRPPPISHAPRYPATAGTIALSLIATVAWLLLKANVSLLLEDAHLAHGQLWRLFTSPLLHNSPLHLIFNLYWLWVFGTLIEQQLGTWKTLALYIFLAAGSGCAEFAILDGGVGLSGVGYGLFGMLWVLSRRDPTHRFDDAIDACIITIFVAWFFLCVVLTATGVWAVANIAHGVGAALGALVGWVMTQPQQMARRRLMTLPALALLILLAAATALRPYFNRSPDRGQEEAFLGYDAEVRHRPAEAARWYRDAVTMRPDAPADWYALG